MRYLILLSLVFLFACSGPRLKVPKLNHKVTGPCIEWSDAGYDGTWDGRIVSTYDSRERLLREQTDETNDGRFDSRVEYEYATDTGLLLVKRGKSETGEQLSETHYTYDQQGRLKEESTADNPQGRIDSIVRYRYAAGHLQERQFFRGPTSPPNTIEKSFYDGQGRLSIVQTDNDGDGSADLSTQYEYDSAGQVVRRDFFAGDEESPYMSDVYRYDANGNRLTKQNFKDGGKLPARIENYKVDAFGNIYEIVTQFNGASLRKSRVIYDYSCW